jgi:hypothetical protein
MSLEDRILVESTGEAEEGVAQLRDGVEATEPEELLFEGAGESLDAAVALGAADEAGAAADAEEGDLLLERVGDELAAVVVTELKLRAGDALGEVAEDMADGLPDGLDGLEAGSASGGVDAQAPAGAVVDEDEGRDVALFEWAPGPNRDSRKADNARRSQRRCLRVIVERPRCPRCRMLSVLPRPRSSSSEPGAPFGAER